MSFNKNPTFNKIRIVPRDDDFLDRKLGFKGEIYFDDAVNSLRIYDGSAEGGYGLARSDFSNVSNADFLAKANAAGVQGGAAGIFELTLAADDSTVRTITSGNTIKFVGGDGINTNSTADGEITITNSQNSFSTIVVAGQSNVVADQLNDTLTFVAGTNVTITTDALTDSITISAVGGGGASNSFSTIAVASQSSVVADSTTDTLTFAAGTGINITTDSSTDTITITSTVTSGVSTFAALTDNASATIDQVYMPAITMLDVTNTGTSAYNFDQYAGGNPTVYVVGGMTIAFKLNVGGHPFLIQDGAGNNYNTGLIHVTTTGVVTTGSSAQGKTSGTLYWKVPASISGGYRYQCQNHVAMVGTIQVKNIVSL